MNIQDPKTVLVYCPNWVGDVVMATPVLDCLRDNFPKARLVGVIREYAAGVLDDGPWFDALITCRERHFKGFWRLVRQVRRVGPDLSLILPNSFRSALALTLAGAGQRVGHRRNGRSLLLHAGPRLPDRRPRPMQDYYFEICRRMDLTPPSSTKPRLFFSEELRGRAEALLAARGVGRNELLLGLNPGAKFGSSKCWPPEYFAELAERFRAAFGCRVLLFTGPGEAEIARAIRRQCREEVIDLGPEDVDLALLKPLIRRCALLVSNDTGPRHYAVALGVPVVVLMGPTDPAYTSGCLDKSLVLRHSGLDCVPCHQKQCPLGHHRCMRSITPEDAYQAGKALLEDAAAKNPFVAFRGQ